MRFENKIHSAPLIKSWTVQQPGYQPCFTELQYFGGCFYLILIASKRKIKPLHAGALLSRGCGESTLIVQDEG